MPRNARSLRAAAFLAGLALAVVATPARAQGQAQQPQQQGDPSQAPVVGAPQRAEPERAQQAQPGQGAARQGGGGGGGAQQDGPAPQGQGGQQQAGDRDFPRSQWPADAPAQCVGPRIVRVRFQGLRRVSADDIRGSVGAREGNCYVRAGLQRDARALWDLGFFSDVQVAADPSDEGGVVVRYVLAERPSIHEVRIQGHDAVEEDKIREVVELREGAVLSESAVRRNAQRIRDLYAEKGYFLAEVRAEVVAREGDENEADVVFHIRENAQVQVRSIQFVGNANVSAEDLRGVMTTGTANFLSFLTNAGTYREEAFRNDVDMLHALYYDRGYLNVEIENPRVALSSDRQFLDVTIFVREGPRYRLGRVRAFEVDDNDEEIAPIGGRRALREMLHFNPGDWFSRTVIGRDIQALQTYYRDRGYASVEVTPDIQPRAGEQVVDLGVRIRRGPPTRVWRIIIRGNQKTADRVIRREMVLHEGDLYNETRYQLSKNRIMQLGYFESVNLSTEAVEGHPDRIQVNVEVTERPTGTFQVGAGFSSVENFILTAQVQQLNLFGRGQSFTLQAQISGLRQIFALRFVEPYLWDSNWTGAVDLYNTLRAYTDFTRYSTGGSLSAGYPLIGTNDLRLALTYTAEQVNVNRRAIGTFLGQNTAVSAFGNVPLANLFQSGFTSAIGLSLTLDTRDNRLFPTSGLYARAGVEIADPYTASQNTYIRWSGWFRFYVPVVAGVIFKGNLTGGLITSRNPQGVPIFERYFLGGILDVRGYRLRTLGPRLPVPRTDDPNSEVVANGLNIGGNLQAYYNLEVEFPILDRIGLRGVLFTDGGNVWNTEAQYCNGARGSFGDASQDVLNPCVVNPLGLRLSWGLGLRWNSPLGLLRFEWGFPINRLAFEEPSVFEFTIGNFF